MKKQGGFRPRDDFFSPNFRPPLLGEGAPPIPDEFFSDDRFFQSDALNSEAPQFTGPLMFDLQFGEQINEQLTWVDDDHDEVKISIPDSVSAGFVTKLGRFIYNGDQFTDNLALLEDLSRVKFIFDDGTNQASFTPNFNVCACRPDSLCDYDNPKSDIDNLFLSGCICTDAFDGRFCEEDKDGCEDPNPPCFPGTECTDQKAPLSGHLCGFCPPGYSGNGFECSADFEETPQNQICFDFPEIDHGQIAQPETYDELEMNNDRGLAAGEILQYICHDGYEMIGASDLRCEEDGVFSEEPPICRDYNECQDNPCHQTAICRNNQGSYDCICDDKNSLSTDDGSCEPMLSFFKGVVV